MFFPLLFSITCFRLVALFIILLILFKIVKTRCVKDDIYFDLAALKSFIKKQTK